MLDKVTCQWMINRKGHILPAFVNAKYHYNEKLGHSFVCFT